MLHSQSDLSFFFISFFFILTLSLVVLYLLYTIQCTSWSISNFYFFLLSNMMCLCEYSFKWYLDLQICGIYHEIWKVISTYAACDWNSTYASQKEKIKGKKKNRLSFHMSLRLTIALWLQLCRISSLCFCLEFMHAGSRYWRLKLSIW